MNIVFRLVSLFCITVFAQQARSDMKIPVYNQDFYNAFYADNPWILGSGQQNAATAQQALNSQRANVATLMNMQEFVDAAAKRPNLQVLTAKGYQMTNQNRYALVRADLLIASNESDLRQNMSESIHEVLRRPISSLFGGMMPLFNDEQRNSIMSARTLVERLQNLRNALAGIPLEQIKAKFRGERFGVDMATVQLSDLDNLVRDAASTSQRFFSAALTLMRQEIEFENAAMAFDNHEALMKAFEAMFKKYDLIANWALIKSELEPWIFESFGVTAVNVAQVTHQLEFKEIPAEADYFRSCLTGNCFTGSSAMYAFSPYERPYVVNQGGHYVGHFAGTIVLVNDKPTFYLHDLRGLSMTAVDLDLTLFAIVHNPQVFGVEEVVILTSAVQGNIGWGIDPNLIRSNTTVSLNYFPDDIKIREKIKPMVGRSGYDSPEANRTAHLINKDVRSRQFAKITLESNTKQIEQQEEAPVTTTMVLGWIGNALEGDKLVKVKEEWRARVFDLVAKLSNQERKNLNEYYADIEGRLGELDITLSKNFFRDHWNLFLQAHHNAPDGWTYQPEHPHHWRIDLMLHELVHSQPSELARILTHHGDWVRSAKLLGTLKKFAVAAHNLERLNVVRSSGQPFGNLLADEPQARENILKGHYDALKFDVLAQELQSQDEKAWTQTEWNALASLLDNEKAPTEEWSLVAARTLAISPHVPLSDDIVKQMRRTIRDEETGAISALTSLAFIRHVALTNYTLDKKLEKILAKAVAILKDDTKNLGDVALSTEVQTFLQSYVAPVESNPEDAKLDENPAADAACEAALDWKNPQK